MSEVVWKEFLQVGMSLSWRKVTLQPVGQRFPRQGSCGMNFPTPRLSYWTGWHFGDRGKGRSLRPVRTESLPRLG